MVAALADEASRMVSDLAALFLAKPIGAMSETLATGIKGVDGGARSTTWAKNHYHAAAWDKAHDHLDYASPVAARSRPLPPGARPRFG